MPISNQPTYQSALQVAMQAGQRRDNLQGMQMQAQQAGINMGQGLLQLALQERALNQADHQFAERVKMQEHQFAEQMTLAKDQQTINKITAQNEQLMQWYAMEHQMTQDNIMLNLEALFGGYEMMAGEHMQEGWNAMLGQESRGGMARELSRALDNIIQPSGDVLGIYDQMGFDEQGQLRNMFGDPVGPQVGSVETPSGQGVPTGSLPTDMRGQGEARVTGMRDTRVQRRGERSATGLAEIGNMMDANRAAEQQHRQQVEFDRQAQLLENLGFDEGYFENLDPDDPTSFGDVFAALSTPSIDDFLDPRGATQGVVQRHRGGARGAWNLWVDFHGWIDDKVGFSKLRGDEDSPTMPRQAMERINQRYESTGDIAHFGRESLDSEQYWTHQERAIDPSWWVRMWRRSADGKGVPREKKNRDLADAKAYQQKRYRAVFEEEMATHGDPAQARKTAIAESIHPAVQLYTIGWNAAYNIYDQLKAGQQISRADIMAFEENIRAAGLGQSIGHYVTNMNRAFNAGKVSGYSVEETNALKGAVELIEQKLVGTTPALEGN